MARWERLENIGDMEGGRNRRVDQVLLEIPPNRPRCLDILIFASVIKYI